MGRILFGSVAEEFKIRLSLFPATDAAEGMEKEGSDMIVIISNV